MITYIMKDFVAFQVPAQRYCISKCDLNCLGWGWDIFHTSKNLNNCTPVNSEYKFVKLYKAIKKHSSQYGVFCCTLEFVTTMLSATKVRTVIRSDLLITHSKYRVNHTCITYKAISAGI